MLTPRIVIDARMVGPQGHGIALYLLDLVHGLRRLQQNNRLPYELFFLVSPKLPSDHTLRHYPLETVRAPFLHPSELFAIPPILRRLKASLYFTPSFSSLYSYPCPHLQTLHDLNHLHYGNIVHSLYYHLLVRPSALRAAALFTVSEAMKREIGNWLGKGKEIELVRNAIQTMPILQRGEDEEILQRFGVEKEQYFFSLSNPKPHKNLTMLEQAYLAYAKREAKPLPLLLSIPGGKMGGVQKVGALSFREVSALLRHANAFFFPSLYEGFGRPPLEAAVSGRSVVCADIPVLREAMSPVPEGEKLFLDPRNPSLWADAFARAQKRELHPVSSESVKKILSTYSVEEPALILDSAIRRCHA